MSNTTLHDNAAGGFTRYVRRALTYATNDAATPRSGDSATPLHLAAEAGHTGVVELLLGPAPVMGGTTATPVVDAATVRGHTALLLAIRGGHDETVGCLLDGGADVNLPSYGGKTPLYMAARGGQLPIVTRLLASPGVDVDARHPDGSSALHVASRNGHQPVVQRLLRTGGADVDARDHWGHTPLMVAALARHAAVVATLLTAGPDVEAADDKGRVPALWHAVRGGSVEVVRQLLLVGANPRVRSPATGQTAAELARQHKHMDVATILDVAAKEGLSAFDQLCVHTVVPPWAYGLCFARDIAGRYRTLQSARVIGWLLPEKQRSVNSLEDLFYAHTLLCTAYRSGTFAACSPAEARIWSNRWYDAVYLFIISMPGEHLQLGLAQASAAAQAGILQAHHLSAIKAAVHAVQVSGARMDLICERLCRVEERQEGLEAAVGGLFKSVAVCCRAWDAVCGGLPVTPDLLRMVAEVGFQLLPFVVALLPGGVLMATEPLLGIANVVLTRTLVYFADTSQVDVARDMLSSLRTASADGGGVAAIRPTPALSTTLVNAFGSLNAFCDLLDRVVDAQAAVTGGAVGRQGRREEGLPPREEGLPTAVAS